MRKNRGVIHIIIIIIGILVILVLLGFFNSVQKNWNLVHSINPAGK